MSGICRSTSRSTAVNLADNFANNILLKLTNGTTVYFASIHSQPFFRQQLLILICMHLFDIFVQSNFVRCKATARCVMRLQAMFGKCDAAFMTAGPYCLQSCGRCGGQAPATPSSPAPVAALAAPSSPRSTPLQVCDQIGRVWTKAYKRMCLKCSDYFIRALQSTTALCSDL